MQYKYGTRNIKSGIEMDSPLSNTTTLMILWMVYNLNGMKTTVV